jgi:hypothetical protein
MEKTMKRIATMLAAAVIVAASQLPAWAHTCQHGHATPDIPALPGACVDGGGTVLIPAPSVGDTGLSTIVQRCLGLGGSLQTGSDAMDGTCAPPPITIGDGTAQPVQGDTLTETLGMIRDLGGENLTPALTIWAYVLAFGVAIALLVVGIRRVLGRITSLVGDRAMPQDRHVVTQKVEGTGAAARKIYYNAAGQEVKNPTSYGWERIGGATGGAGTPPMGPRAEIAADRELAGVPALDDADLERAAQELVDRRARSGYYTRGGASRARARAEIAGARSLAGVPALDADTLDRAASELVDRRRRSGY